MNRGRLEVVGKQIRRKPLVGDIVTMHVSGVGWLYGRVIKLDVATSPWGSPWADTVLFYVFRHVSQEEPTAAPESLLVENLLIEPVIVDRSVWLGGYVKVLGNRPIRSGEAFERHCFLSRGYNKYYDEDANELAVPFEPHGFQSLTLPLGIEERICLVLGLSDACGSVTVEEPTGISCNDDQLVIIIPDPIGKDDRSVPTPDIMTIEEALEQAIRNADAEDSGGWEGHGYDIELKRWDIRFEGPKPKRLSEVLLPALKRLKLPDGSYMLVGGRTTKRIDL